MTRVRFVLVSLFVVLVDLNILLKMFRGNKSSRRNCAIKDCTNNWYALEKWMEEPCLVHKPYNKGIGTCICSPPFTLFPFPTERKDPEARRKWTSIVNRKDWTPKSESRICSNHFVEGSPTVANPYPTLNLGYTPSKNIKSRPPPLERISSSPPLKKIRRKLECTKVNHASTSAEKVEQEVITPVMSNAISDHNYSVDERDTLEPIGNININDSEQNISENMKLKIQIEKLKRQVKHYKSLYNSSITTKKRSFNIDIVLTNDKKCKFYTGIPTVQAFNDIFAIIDQKAKNMKHWKGPKRNCNPLAYKRRIKAHTRKLSNKEEFILTLVKLRLGLLFQDLADRFEISITHASNIFTTWIKVLSHTIGSLVFNPPKEAVITNLPPSFEGSKYKNVRHIIDCTEVFLEKPNNLEVSALTWSDYKHHNTAKFLVSITPSGLINFVSECWGGRSSDKFITNHSGFLDIIEPFDTVMADRGFTIREDLALLSAELFIPPGRRGTSQMSTSEVRQTKDIANRRIYIEQAIRRMKTFRILKFELPLTLAQHIDYIVKTIAGLCNLYPPLPKYNKAMQH